MSPSFPEVDYDQASSGEVASAFFANGCVLLRNFLQEDKLFDIKGRLSSIYDETGAIQLFAPDLKQRMGSNIHEFLFGDRHYDLLEKIFRSHSYKAFQGTLARRIQGFAGEPRWMAPLAPHLDAFFHRFEFTVNFWVPLQACGGDPSSLGVIPGDFACMLEFTGYDGKAAERGGPGKWNLGNFRPKMWEMNLKQDGAADELFATFADRIWTPEYKLGDAMLISNWTMHFTHANPVVTAAQRENIELRFICDASLDTILKEHSG